MSCPRSLSDFGVLTGVALARRYGATSSVAELVVVMVRPRVGIHYPSLEIPVRHAHDISSQCGRLYHRCYRTPNR